MAVLRIRALGQMKAKLCKGSNRRCAIVTRDDMGEVADFAGKRGRGSTRRKRR